MKEKITAIIERDEDGKFCISATEVFHDCQFIGSGDTVDQAKADFVEAMNFMLTEEVGINPQDVEVEFRYDVRSFLNEYKGILSLSGMQVMTGINQRQLHHYLSGVRKPSKTTVDKIREGVHRYAEKLLETDFV